MRPPVDVNQRTNETAESLETLQTPDFAQSTLQTPDFAQSNGDMSRAIPVAPQLGGSDLGEISSGERKGVCGYDTRKQRAPRTRNATAVPIGFICLLCLHASLSVQARQTILTVGEGDFAFSVALRARLDSMQGDYHLLATCFDSRESVLTKYPQSSSLLPRLERHQGVRVAFGVDATNLSSTVCAVEGPFDLVIFNFPHTGLEDYRRHQALLAHFVASAKALLTWCGQIQIALANDQPERWAVQEMAALSSMHLLEARVFRPEDEFPGYTARRTTRQKSFRRTRPCGNARVYMQAHRFTFSRCPGSGPESKIQPCCSAGLPMERGQARHSVWLPAPLLPSSEEESASAAADPARENASEASISRGGIHPTRGVANEAPDGEAPLHTCADCARNFQSGDALHQHRRAKHGRLPHLKPDWFAKRSASADAPPVDSSGRRSVSLVEGDAGWCSVCRVMFQSEAGLEAHRRSLRPLQHPDYACSGCERRFFEQRALLQHANVCPAVIAG